MKAVKIISTFLGFAMFMFGVLKFVNPFKGWYSVQIMNSGMNEFLYWPGITGEISVGILFIGNRDYDYGDSNTSAFKSQCPSKCIALKNKAPVYTRLFSVTCHGRHIFNRQNWIKK